MRRTGIAAAFALLALACQDDSREQPAADADVVVRDSVRDSVPDAVEPPDQPVPDESAVLTPNGWGKLKIGMTRAEVVAAAGEDSNPDAVGGPDPATCDQFRPANAPNGLLVMIMNGKLSRISITRDASIKTDGGFGVGDAAVAIKAAYGSKAVTTPHAYGEAPQEYITVWTQPKARGIVYEIGGDGRIVRINAGDESIENVEGCV